MSIRRTRTQWIESLFPLRLNIFHSPPLTGPYELARTSEKVKRPGKEKLAWKYKAPVPGMSGTVYAHTRSEARSEIKKLHGITGKGRVPLDTIITLA